MSMTEEQVQVPRSVLEQVDIELQHAIEKCEQMVRHLDEVLRESRIRAAERHAALRRLGVFVDCPRCTHL